VARYQAVVDGTGTGSPALCLTGARSNNIWVDGEPCKAGMVRRQAVSDEAGTEDRGKSPTKVPAEGSADSTSTPVRHPVALSCDGATSYAER
jgi:hypothetical protein